MRLWLENLLIITILYGLCNNYLKLNAHVLQKCLIFYPIMTYHKYSSVRGHWLLLKQYTFWTNYYCSWIFILQCFSNTFLNETTDIKITFLWTIKNDIFIKLNLTRNAEILKYLYINLRTLQWISTFDSLKCVIESVIKTANYVKTKFMYMRNSAPKSLQHISHWSWRRLNE